MKPPFDVLAKNFHSKRKVLQPELFAEIGWEELVGNGNFNNTCAIRLSLALIKSGVRIKGRLAIKKGPHLGKMIETGQALLSRNLAQRNVFGPPEKFKEGTAKASLAGRRGVVSFFRVDPAMNDNGGHIDIVAPGLQNYYDDLGCGSDCYWQSGEIWFWPLK